MKTSDKSFIRSLFLFIVKDSGQTYNRLITKRYSKENNFTVNQKPIGTGLQDKQTTIYSRR